MIVLTAPGRFRGERLETDPYRAKAARTPINGPYKEAAKIVRHLLGWEDGSARPYLSTRNAQNKTGISNGTINTLAHGGKVSANIVEIFANRLNADPERLKLLFGHVSPDQINRSAGESDPLSRIGPNVDISGIAGVRLSPFLVSAGGGSHIQESSADYETFEQLLPGQVRAIRVVGECMEPFYREGDVVFVREQGNAENGNKVVALVDGENLNCKLYRTNGENYLEPKNGEGRIPASRFRIIGVIVGVFRKED